MGKWLQRHPWIFRVLMIAGLALELRRVLRDIPNSVVLTAWDCLWIVFFGALFIASFMD